MKFDLERLEVAGPSTQVLAGVRTDQANSASSFAFARDGTLVYAAGGPRPDRTLVWVDRRGEASAVMHDEGGYHEVRLSPGGRLVAVVVGRLNHSVWIYDLVRGTFSPLTHGWDDHFLVWTPDGKRVLFSSDRRRPRSIYSKRVDGSGDVELVLGADQEQHPYSTSSDGEVLAVGRLHPSGGMDILMRSMDGESSSREFLATEFYESLPQFSPNGRWVAYESDESGQLEVYVTPFPGPGRECEYLPRADSSRSGPRAVESCSTVTVKDYSPWPSRPTLLSGPGSRSCCSKGRTVPSTTSPRTENGS